MSNSEIPCLHLLSCLEAGMDGPVSPSVTKKGITVWTEIARTLEPKAFQMKDRVRIRFYFSCQTRFQYRNDDTRKT